MKDPTSHYSSGCFVKHRTTTNDIVSVSYLRKVLVVVANLLFSLLGLLYSHRNY